jgi:hypothetical protein
MRVIKRPVERVLDQILQDLESDAYLFQGRRRSYPARSYPRTDSYLSDDLKLYRRSSARPSLSMITKESHAVIELLLAFVVKLVTKLKLFVRNTWYSILFY